MIDPTLENVCKVLALAVDVANQVLTTAIESDSRLYDWEKHKLDNLRNSLTVTGRVLEDILE